MKYISNKNGSRPEPLTFWKRQIAEHIFILRKKTIENVTIRWTHFRRLNKNEQRRNILRKTSWNGFWYRSHGTHLYVWYEYHPRQRPIRVWLNGLWNKPVQLHQQLTKNLKHKKCILKLGFLLKIKIEKWLDQKKKCKFWFPRVMFFHIFYTAG